MANWRREVLLAVAIAARCLAQISAGCTPSPELDRFYREQVRNARQGTENAFRKLADDPNLPWTHWALMEIYGSQTFHDPAKLAAATLEFSRLCPDDLDAFNRIDLIDNPDIVRDLATRFRSALERRNTSDVADYYPRLWAAESRAAGPGQADTVRRITADLARIVRLNAESYKAQLDAYKRLGDTAMAEAMQEKLAETPSRLNVYQTVSEWMNSHSPPSPNAPPEARTRWEEEELAASASWVRDWPDEPYAWGRRFSIVARRPKTTAEEIERLGDRVVEVARAHPSPWSQSPEFLAVAQEWSKRGIRLADCTTLAAEAVESFCACPTSRMTCTAMRQRGGTALPPPSRPYSARTRSKPIPPSSAETTPKRKTSFSQMKSWIDRHPTDNPRPFSTYSLAQARLADAQGHTMDALAFYQRAIQAGNLDADVMSRVRTLWDRQGGGTEALEAWLLRTPDAAASSSWTAPATDWLTTDKTLEALHAEDLAGRMWSVSDLQGKTTFINVWATWCGPCVDELPYVEKLFALLRGRKDIQLVSLNIDDDPATAAAFLQQGSFTFPTIPAKKLVHSLLQEVSIPRNWIADPTAHIRAENIGFDPRAVNWPHDMLEKLMRPLR